MAYTIFEQIERVKQEMRDYENYTLRYNVDEKTKQRRMDMYLDLLSYLLKQQFE